MEKMDDLLIAYAKFRMEMYRNRQLRLAQRAKRKGGRLPRIRELDVIVILAVIANEDCSQPYGQASLAAALDIPRSTLQRSLRRLQIWGLLQTRRHPHAVVIEPTTSVWRLFSATSTKAILAPLRRALLAAYPPPPRTSRAN